MNIIKCAVFLLFPYLYALVLRYITAAEGAETPYAIIVLAIYVLYLVVMGIVIKRMGEIRYYFLGGLLLFLYLLISLLYASNLLADTQAVESVYAVLGVSMIPVDVGGAWLHEATSHFLLLSEQIAPIVKVTSLILIYTLAYTFAPAAPYRHPSKHVYIDTK